MDLKHWLKVSVADPHHLGPDPNPDPSFHFDADPDPTFPFVWDPDSAPYQSDSNRRALVTYILRLHY
jgi:hypothetical protein